MDPTPAEAHSELGPLCPSWGVLGLRIEGGPGIGGGVLLSELMTLGNTWWEPAGGWRNTVLVGGGGSPSVLPH